MQGQPLQAELVGTAPELGYAAVAITVSLSRALSPFLGLSFDFAPDPNFGR